MRWQHMPASEISHVAVYSADAAKAGMLVGGGGRGGVCLN